MFTFKRIFVVLAVLLAFASLALAQEFPSPVGPVSDYAGELSTKQATALRAELVAFEKETSVELAVVIVTTLGGRDVETYTRGLATTWGVGKRGKDNGIVFLHAPVERKFWIAVADGIRPRLPDRQTQHVYNTFILPKFKAGDLAGGVIDGARAIMAAVRQPVILETPVPVETPEQRAERERGVQIVGYVIIGLIFVFVVIVLVVLPMMRNADDRQAMLEAQQETSGYLTETARLARSADVPNEMRAQLEAVQREFQDRPKLTKKSKKVNWEKVRKGAEAMRDKAWAVKRDISDRINFVQEARTNGPALMEQMPALLEDAAKRITTGKPSSNAAKQLLAARKRFEDARHAQEGMTTMDWVVLYLILSEVTAHRDSALHMHEGVNYVSHSSPSSYSSHDSGGGGGFDSGGFGGGGGFSGGGGGGSY